MLKPITNPIVIIYDGDCVFCSRSMAWIARHDSRRRIRFTACTSPLGGQIMRQHGVDPEDPSTFLVMIDGKAYERSEAMLQLAAVLDWQARPLLLFRGIPQVLRDKGYDWTARNRRKIMGKGECPVPSPEMLERMLP